MKKIYLIVNKDLDISKAKTGVQIGHACTQFTVDNCFNKDFLEWFNNNQTKIILKTSESNMLRLEEMGFITIRDNGLTEIPSNSLTCIALGLWDREDLYEKLPFVKRWRLL